MKKEKKFWKMLFERIFHKNKQKRLGQGGENMGQKISELLKEQIEKSEYPVVGAKYNNEYKNFRKQICGNVWPDYRR